MSITEEEIINSTYKISDENLFVKISEKQLDKLAKEFIKVGDNSARKVKFDDKIRFFVQAKLKLTKEIYINGQDWEHSRKEVSEAVLKKIAFIAKQIEEERESMGDCVKRQF